MSCHGSHRRAEMGPSHCSPTLFRLLPTETRMCCMCRTCWEESWPHGLLVSLLSMMCVEDLTVYQHTLTLACAMQQGSRVLCRARACRTLQASCSAARQPQHESLCVCVCFRVVFSSSSSRKPSANGVTLKSKQHGVCLGAAGRVCLYGGKQGRTVVPSPRMCVLYLQAVFVCSFLRVCVRQSCCNLDTLVLHLFAGRMHAC